MNALLKSLADASLEVAAAEDALAEGAFTTARERVDAAGAVLADLRAAWPAMSAAERGVVGPAAADIRGRLDGAVARVPRVSALSVGAPVEDPEQDEPPAV